MRTLADATAQIYESEQRVHKLEHAISPLQQQICAYQTELAETQARAGWLQQKLSERGSRTAELRAEEKMQANRLEELQHALQSLRKRLEILAVAGVGDDSDRELSQSDGAAIAALQRQHALLEKQREEICDSAAAAAHAIHLSHEETEAKLGDALDVSHQLRSFLQIKEPIVNALNLDREALKTELLRCSEKIAGMVQEAAIQTEKQHSYSQKMERRVQTIERQLDEAQKRADRVAEEAQERAIQIRDLEQRLKRGQAIDNQRVDSVLHLRSRLASETARIRMDRLEREAQSCASEVTTKSVLALEQCSMETGKAERIEAQLIHEISMSSSETTPRGRLALAVAREQQVMSQMKVRKGELRLRESSHGLRNDLELSCISRISPSASSTATSDELQLDYKQPFPVAAALQ